MPAERHDRLGRHVGLVSGAVRMGADGVPDLRVRLRQGLVGFRLGDPRRDGDHAGHARLSGAGDDAGQVLGEVREIEVAVTIDQHL
jgi:hypothetical protein